MGTIRFNRQRKAWMIDYIAADGRRVRQIIGHGEEAKRLAREILTHREAEAILGKHHIPTSQTMRFADFAEDWLKRITRRIKPKTLETYENAMRRHLLPHFGDMRLGAITRREVESYLLNKVEKGTRRGKEGKAAPLAAATVNKGLAVLKLILQDAVEHGLLTESTALRVRPLKDRDEGGDRFNILQPAEIERLLQAAEEPYRGLYLLAVHTGMRRGELLGLRWRDVDLATGRIHVRRSLARFRIDKDRYVVGEAPLKSRYSRRVIDDLASAAIAALRELPRGDDPERDYVFLSRAGGPIDPDNLDRAFKRHLDLAGLPEIRFHDLRHTHASLLIAAGVHPKAIQARLGHASITTTLNTYGHLMPSAFQGVGSRLDALLQGNTKATNPASDAAGNRVSH